jgi:hypothetical protein
MVIAEHHVSERKNAEVINRDHLSEMWKLSLGKRAVPSSKKLQVLFENKVAATALQTYEEVIG